jgi:sulfite exporter TauE/SafE
LVFVKYLEGKTFADKLAQVCIFAVTRAVLIGALGAVAIVIGTAFMGFQKAAWIVLGAIYLAIGLLYIFRRAGSLKGPASMAFPGHVVPSPWVCCLASIFLPALRRWYLPCWVWLQQAA